MKKITIILFSMALLMLFSSTESKAQASFSATVQLNRPARYERNERYRPNRPSQAHVWVNEEWVGRGRRHQYHPGHWTMPPSQDQVWEPGRWDPSPQYPDKYVWVAGHWRPRTS